MLWGTLHEQEDIDNQQTLSSRCYVTPARVEELHVKLWGKDALELTDLATARTYCHDRLEAFRQDILRPLNPTPYKLSVSSEFFTFFKDMWERQAPIKELS